MTDHDENCVGSGDPVPHILGQRLLPIWAWFAAPNWELLPVLVVGAILCLGKQTVTACLRITGRADAGNFSLYHQLLNRTRWKAIGSGRGSANKGDFVMSTRQLLCDDVVETVRCVLADTGLPVHRLTLEVTESVMITEPEHAIETLNRLKSMGVSISLDDFGTGYSALAYLLQFEWDELKIDRSFVSALDTNQRSSSILRAITILGRKLGSRIVVEGIENETQRAIITRFGCTVAQEYLFERPVPASELNFRTTLSTSGRLREFDHGKTKSA